MKTLRNNLKIKGHRFFLADTITAKLFHFNAPEERLVKIKTKKRLRELLKSDRFNSEITDLYTSTRFNYTVIVREC